MASAGFASPENVRAQLVRILAAAEFAPFPRSAALLTYVVEEALAGRNDSLKEAVIGVEVFGRSPGYDPKADSIVRTQARRVREKLAEYYQGAGQDDPVRITIPKGAYIPEFVAAVKPPAVPAARASRRMAVAAFSLCLAAAGILLLAWHRGIPRVTTVGILPFLDRDPAHAYAALAGGLTEDLERDLSRARDLRIHAHPTGLTPEARADYTEVARRLAVDAVIDGSIVRENGDAEIRVALIRGADRALLWTGRFPATGAIGGTERRIEDAVAAALGVKPPAHAAHTENPRAHDLYFAGRALWATREPAKSRQAIALYEEALRIDPEYALAYMGIADAYALMAGNGQIEPYAAIARGVPAVRRALELDPSLAEAHAAFGMLYLAQRDYQNAAGEYQRAIELNPSYDRAYVRAGTLQFWFGDFPQAEKLIRESERLNPYAMSLPMIRSELYYYWRRYDDSITLAKVVLQADPGYATAYQVMARDYLQKGDAPRAVAAARAAVAKFPDRMLYVSELASYLFRSGQTREAENLAALVLEPGPPDEVDPLVVALMYARMMDREKTLRYLAAAYSARSVDLPSIRFDPALDFVRDDPRYRAIAAKVTPSSK